MIYSMVKLALSLITVELCNYISSEIIIYEPPCNIYKLNNQDKAYTLTGI